MGEERAALLEETSPMRRLGRQKSDFVRRLWAERAVFGAVILTLILIQIWGALAGRRGVICVDGSEVAVVGDARTAHALVDGVLSDLAGEMREDAEFVQEVTVSVEKRRARRVMSAEVAKEKLTKAVEVGATRWAIVVDGEPVLALDSQEDAGEALALYVARNSGRDVGPEAAPTQFVEDVAVERRLVPLGLYVESAEAAFEYLNDGKQKRVYHVVKAGETGYEIAHRYGMGYYRLRDLNPGKNLDRLRIGDKLTVSESEPLITVVATRRASLSESIDCPVRVVKSGKLYTDQQVTKQRGRLGQRLVDAVVTVVNGRILDREVLQSRIVKEPVAQIVLVGTKKRPPGYLMAQANVSGEAAARRIYLMYRRGNSRGHFRGVYGMKELGVGVATAHSLNHAFGVHYAYNLSWDTVVRYLERGDHSFGGRWGCSGGPHNPPGAARWIRRNILK